MAVLVKQEEVGGIIFAFLEDANDSDIKFFISSFPQKLVDVPGVYTRWWEFVKEAAIVVLADSNGLTEEEVRGKFDAALAAQRLH